MNELGIITFISDTGWGGGYAAVLEAMVTRLQPAARVFHISHEVPAGDVAAGALTLARIAPLYPSGVHVAIVDPGVGTGRRPLALVAERGDVLVGPDNGVLLPAAEALGGLRSAWILDPVGVRRRAGLPVDEISHTFHGRDIFAPTAALLTTVAEPSAFAVTTEPASLVPGPEFRVEITETGVLSEVIEIDRFGNIGLAIRYPSLLPKRGEFLVELPDEDLPEWTARVVRTYGDLRAGELGIFCDSWGHVALALNSASAAQLLSVERGMMVRLTAQRTTPSDEDVDA